MKTRLLTKNWNWSTCIWMVKCNDDLNLILKPSEFKKAYCVSDDTRNKLGNLGWSIVPSNYQDW